MLVFSVYVFISESYEPHLQIEKLVKNKSASALFEFGVARRKMNRFYSLFKRTKSVFFKELRGKRVRNYFVNVF